MKLAFEAEMQQQKDRSRAATALDTEDWVILSEDGSYQICRLRYRWKQKPKY